MKLSNLMVVGWSMSMVGCLAAAPEQQPFEIPSDEKAGGYTYSYRATEIIPIGRTAYHGDGALRDAVEAVRTGPMTYELQGPVYELEFISIQNMAFEFEGRGLNSSDMGYMVVVKNEDGTWGSIRSLPYTDVAREAHAEYPSSLPASDAGNRQTAFPAVTTVSISSAGEWTLNFPVEETADYPDGAFRRAFLGEKWKRDGKLTIGLLPTPVSHWWSIEGTNPYEVWFIPSVMPPMDMP